MYKLRIQDTSPYQIKSYPIPIAHRAAVAEEIARMLRYDIIERSYSQYVNPIVAVVKKNNTVRLCLDARELNKRLDNDHDGPEEIGQLLKKCAKIGIMSSVDLRASFWADSLASGLTHSGPIARARRALEKEQGHRVEEPVSHVETSRAVTEAQIRARRRLKATEEEHLREQRRNQDIKKEYTRQWIARSFGTLDLKLPEGDIKRSTFPMCRIPADDVLQIHVEKWDQQI
ncbi:unnamed protein product [Trichogramma brassicae]|uniref:Reverse transcriptase domain-containing protein n=1 Tax=Trichogramma brassicae TaxID=86971 RepID=A0A6H5IW17_9HYME|nr:unnamed protein product [Trichogramma brassicae]